MPDRYLRATRRPHDEEFGTSLRSQSSEISLPVIVLWTPEQDAADG